MRAKRSEHGWSPPACASAGTRRTTACIGAPACGGGCKGAAVACRSGYAGAAVACGEDVHAGQVG
jgi:hypothetical protein